MDSVQNPFLATLRLPIKDSPIIALMLVIAHGFSLFVPWLTGLDLTYKIMLTCGPVSGLVYLFYKYCSGFAKKQTTELILAANDDWQLKQENGQVLRAVLDDSLFVHPLLTIILLRFGDNKEYFIFTPDNLDADLFRRLRVRLRFRVTEG